MPGASPVNPETPANAAASAAFWSSALDRYNLLMSMPIPTASSTANIPIADVARIEPRSRFLSTCSTDLFFMFAPSYIRTKIGSTERGSYQGLTESGFEFIVTALATGRAGLLLRTLPTEPLVLD